MSFRALLRRVAEKIAPGRSPSYGEAQILRALEIVSEGSIGRAALGGKLGVGEGVVRTLIRRLTSEGLVEVSTRGISTSKRGDKLLRDVHTVIPAKGTAPPTGDTVGAFNYALLVRGGAPRVRFGLEQRDAALIAGASGATTVVNEERGLIIPGIDRAPTQPLLRFIEENLTPEEGDVVIVGTGGTVVEAETGAYAAALTLV